MLEQGRDGHQIGKYQVFVKHIHTEKHTPVDLNDISSICLSSITSVLLNILILFLYTYPHILYHTLI